VEEISAKREVEEEDVVDCYCERGRALQKGNKF
jgi:hypothetical protein